MKRQNTKIPVYDAEYIESSTGPWRHKPKPRKTRSPELLLAFGMWGAFCLFVGVAIGRAM